MSERERERERWCGNGDWEYALKTNKKKQKVYLMKVVTFRAPVCVCARVYKGVEKGVFAFFFLDLSQCVVASR